MHSDEVLNHESHPSKLIMNYSANIIHGGLVGPPNQVHEETYSCIGVVSNELRLLQLEPSYRKNQQH